MFPLRADGTLHKWCPGCKDEWDANYRLRVLMVEQMFNQARLSITVGDGDDLDGLTCAHCGRAFTPGDVAVCRTELHHEDCAK